MASRQPAPLALERISAAAADCAAAAEKGDVAAELEANLNRFDILNDETVSSGSNPAIRQYESGAEVAVYDDSGWQTAELKLRTRPDPSRQWQWAAGLRHERYQLNYDIYDSPDWHSAEKEELVNSSGGRTRIDAAYLQLNRTVADRWDIALGGRMEYFRSADGYFSRSTGDGLAIVPTPDNDLRRLSPKASVGLQFGQQWQARYSVARAYRFPIVEELFSQFSAYNAISQANPELGPERGMHQNLMLDHQHLFDRYDQVLRMVTEAFGENTAVLRQAKDEIRRNSESLDRNTALLVRSSLSSQPIGSPVAASSPAGASGGVSDPPDATGASWALS